MMIKLIHIFLIQILSQLQHKMADIYYPILINMRKLIYTWPWWISTLIPLSLMIRIHSLVFKELNNNWTFHSAYYLYKVFNLSW